MCLHIACVLLQKQYANGNKETYLYTTLNTCFQKQYDVEFAWCYWKIFTTVYERQANKNERQMKRLALDVMFLVVNQQANGI